MSNITNFLRHVSFFIETLPFNKAVTKILSYIKTSIFLKLSRGPKYHCLGYTVSTPSKHMLSGLISEIFFNETYPIQPTNNTLTIFDCGANIGMSTLYFKKMCPNALVSAFEPNPATYRYLQENIHSNHLKDVTTYMIGLGGTPGETTLYTDEKLEASSGASITRHLESKDKKTSEVTITIKKLSDYIDKKIDILKLDVEGAEGEVFDDLKRENKFALIENIYMEYHYDGIHTTYPLSKILSTLEESGFKYLIKSQFTKHISHYKNQIHAYIIIAWR